MMKKKLRKLKLGLKRTVGRRVEFRWTMAAYDRRLPPVLSTPAMIGLMETAAAELMRPYLPKGSISVGTQVNVDHRAPALAGAHIAACARLKRIHNNRYTFSVEARRGKTLLGQGTIERAIVELGAFRERLQSKPR